MEPNKKKLRLTPQEHVIKEKWNKIQIVQRNIDEIENNHRLSVSYEEFYFFD